MKKIIKVLAFLGVLLAILALLKDVYYKPYTRICSWNIELFGLIDIEDQSQPYYQEIAKRINVIDPAIVCIQEVSSIVGAKFLTENLPDYNLYINNKIAKENQEIFSENSLDTIIQQLRKKNRGKLINDLLMNCFLVKKNIHVKDFQTIHRRCVKLTYVDPFVNNGEDVTIYNFHLPSDYSNNNSDKRKEILSEVMSQIENPISKNVLLCGDFNALKDSYEISTLLDNNFLDSRDIIQSLSHQKTNAHSVDMWNTISWEEDDYHGNLEGKIERRIDFFFVSKHLSSHVLGGFTDRTQCLGNIGDLLGPVSDHCAICLDLS